MARQTDARTVSDNANIGKLKDLVWEHHLHKLWALREQSTELFIKLRSATSIWQFPV